MEELLALINESKAHLAALAKDTHELVQNINVIVREGRQSASEIGEIVHTVRRWADRTDRFVEEVEDAIEPPLLAAVRSVMGVGKFLRGLIHHNGHQ